PSKHWLPNDIGLRQPDGVSLHPDGRYLAVADRKSGRDGDGLVALNVAVLDLTNDEVAQQLVFDQRDVINAGFLDTSQAPGIRQVSLNRVTWLKDKDGIFLVAGGVAWCQIGLEERTVGTVDRRRLDNCLVRWRFDPESTERSEPIMIRAGLHRIMDLKTDNASSQIIYASQRRVAAIDKDGRATPDGGEGGGFKVVGQLFDFRDRRKAVRNDVEQYLDFATSTDDGSIFFEGFQSSDRQPGKLTFDPKRLSLSRYGELPDSARAPLGDPLHVSHARFWKNQRQPPELFGLADALPTLTVDRYRSVATTEDGFAAIGSANFIRVLKVEDGDVVHRCELRVAEEAFRINMSNDGSLVIVAHSDGTIRWYGVTYSSSAAGAKGCDIKLRLAVTLREVRPGSGEWTWIAVVPGSGHFAADPNARNLIEWQVEGPRGQVERVDTRLVWQSLLRPSVVRKAATKTVTKAGVSDKLLAKIRENIDPSRVDVLTPQIRTAVQKPSLAAEILLSGENLKGRNLWIRTGGGIGIAKVLGNNEIAANLPIKLDERTQLKVTLTLPPSMRRSRGEKQICFHIDRWPKSCHTILWAGPLAPPKPRKLHGVVVGVADYASDRLNLGATDNDAIDFATVFIDDYRKRVVDGKSSIKPDFVASEFDIFIASADADKKQELDALAKNDFVRVHQATRVGFLSVLSDLEKRVKREPKFEHRFLIYFAGHGIVQLSGETQRSAFLFPPDSNGNLTRVLGKEIIDRLERLDGDIIVVFDACRTPEDDTPASQFDPASLEREFAARALSATIMFGSKAGQAALEQSELALKQRTASTQGNGIFTYALVKSLTSREADTSRDNRGRDRIELIEVEQFLHYFFDQTNRDAPVSKLQRSLSTAKGQYLQQPTIVRPRVERSGSRILRTLDKAPAGASAINSLCAWPFLRNWSLICKN
ncbi:MAG: caspase family protein, partial [Pseudomonadota bacterium]